MTVSTTTSTITYSGNGVTTSFTFPFIGVAAADIEVTYTDPDGVVTILPDTTYTLVLNAAAVGSLWGIGGTVTYPILGTPIPVDSTLRITRILPYTQTISISNQGSFYPQAVEQALDKLELQIQQIADPTQSAADAEAAATSAALSAAEALASEEAAAVYAAAAQSGATGNQGRNRFLNGDCRINQINGTSTVTPSVSAYVMDQYYLSLINAPSVTVGQNYGGVTPPTGFSYYIGIKTTTPVTVGAGDYNSIRQYVEFLNVQDFNWGSANAKTVTLSFWAYASATGTYGGSIRNRTTPVYSYPFTYTINSSNTWELKTITIAGPTAGTFYTADTSPSFVVSWNLGTGATYSGTAGAWVQADYISATGATNILGTLNATLYLTGMQIEVGSTATSFEYVDYATMLQRCERYYQLLGASQTSATLIPGAAYSATDASAWLPYRTRMRIAPTVTLPAAGTSSNQMTFLKADGTTPGVIGTLSADAINLDSITVGGHAYTGAWTAGNAVYLNMRSGAVIRLDSQF